MAVTGSGINNFCMTASGDSLIGNFFLRDIRAVFSAGAAGNSALLVDGNNSVIFHAIADAANYTDGWAIMKHVDGIELAAVTGDAEIFLNVMK